MGGRGSRRAAAPCTRFTARQEPRPPNQPPPRKKDPQIIGPMNLTAQQTLERLINRRAFLSNASIGVGAAALAGLMQRTLFGAATAGESFAAANPLAASHGIINPLHFKPTAKRVIFLCMAGGPSQFETFDEKP